ncbi:neutral zinc metallopeptidase [Arenicella sp. 4NH20-0111]|uniref:KPN_02809 family neutral zinc metallopeptidase n=1 Tax=Arenicella sp. 4NH20-0111 TaxID=3127648 RepID=UPI00310A5687
MRWRGRRQSSNVEDRRGQGMLRSKRGAGGGAMILLVLAGLFFGEDVQKVLSLFVGNGQVSQQSQPTTTQASNDQNKQFVSTILAETEDTWNAVFAESGSSYQAPKLVLYEGRTPTACGVGQAASGPFYCPGDYKIYIDLSFMNELKKMGAPGDFAFAYVIAHEVGHHIQNLIGVASDVRQKQARASKAVANGLSVKMELQADCLAGIWINHTERRSSILEQGDIEEGFSAAAAVGDDTIMSRAGMPPRRENFTHGSSKERMHWFQQGMKTGSINSCQTFD